MLIVKANLQLAASTFKYRDSINVLAASLQVSFSMSGREAYRKSNVVI